MCALTPAVSLKPRSDTPTVWSAIWDLAALMTRPCCRPSPFLKGAWWVGSTLAEQKPPWSQHLLVFCQLLALARSPTHWFPRVKRPKYLGYTGKWITDDRGKKTKQIKKFWNLLFQKGKQEPHTPPANVLCVSLKRSDERIFISHSGKSLANGPC